MIGTPALGNLVGAYLNQDWHEDYPDVWAVVDAFSAEHPDAASVPAEIDWVLATFDSESEIKNYLAELGTGYAADWDGSTYRGWLKEVSSRVTAAMG